ncbi:hypothetical protein MF1_05090 [Bartonella quintana]|uniref:SPOR domain-containing protein n=1 Tax=Bartonella quintana TaxID=803 RepID=UPI00131902F6|nr:SPOR domain-containing protein [Bartonella quintana]BBL53251.1 hypothetical protein MF1_05090 [Bartonella quintana]
MSDNDRKNSRETKQDHEHNNPLEKLTRIFNPNKQSENQKDPSFLQTDRSISQTSKTSFHGDDFDLPFLEAELENNLIDDQKKKWDLHKTSNEPTSDITQTASFNHLEQNSFLSEESEEVHSSPIGNDEEQILDALSPLPIQKNQLPQNKTIPTRTHHSFEKRNFRPQSENFFFDESDKHNNKKAPSKPDEQANPFSQTIAQQPNLQTIQQNCDDNQSLHDIPLNHSYKVSADQENWIEEYYASAPNPSMGANTGFSSANLISEKQDTARNELTSDVPSLLDSIQIDNNPSDLKGFPQKDHTHDYPQFYEEKFLKQEVYTAKTHTYGDTQTQYINNDETISEQNNEKEVLYHQNNLSGTPPSSKIHNTTQTDSFFAHNTTHRDTPPPNVDTSKFAEEIVEKTGPIMVPELPEYDVPPDGLKEELADVFNVGNVPAEDFSRRQQKNEVLNEIFHQTVHNPREDAYININSKEQSANYFSADDIGDHSCSLTENLSSKGVDEIPTHASTTPPLKSFIVGKTLTRSFVFLILLATGFIGYFSFFMPSQKNESTPIIRAENTPFKFKQESTEKKDDVAHNLDIYKQTTGENEKQENTQQFLIDNSELPKELATLNQQESTSISSSSLDKSDVENAVTEAINHTIPTQEVQTVIVKQDGTVVLAPIHHTERKTADKLEERIDQAPIDQDTASVSSHFSDTNHEEAEQKLMNNIDKIIAENASSSNIEGEIENPFIPTPSHAKSNSQDQIHAASRPTPPVRVGTQNSENYYVQLASLPTHALAKNSLKNMKSRFGFLIGARSLNIQSALIPRKGTYYRVRIQTQNRNEAISLCEDIKNSGGSCFVTR